MDRRVDVAISAVFVAFGLFVIFEASTIKDGLYTDPIGPRAFFYGCGIIFVLGGLANIVQKTMLEGAASGHLTPSEGVEDEPGHPASFRRAATIALLGIAYVVLLVPLGYLITTPIFILAALWVLEHRRWFLNIVVAIVFTVTFYIIFAQGLSVWLPVGPFTQLFRDLGWIIL